MPEPHSYTGGTITVTNGSTAVTGSLTAWASSVLPGDEIVIGATRAIVETVNSNTSITLNAAWSGSTYTGAAYIIAYRSALRHDVTRLSLLYARWQREGTNYITTTGQPDNSVGNDGWVAFDLAAKTFYQKVGGAWDSGTSFAGELTRSGSVASGDVVSWVSNSLVKKATAAEVRAAGGGLREVLTAARTYYVRPDGSDSNNGLTNATGGSFLTVQRAVNAAMALDTNGYGVTIELAYGSFAENIAVSSPLLGGGALTIRGSTGFTVTLALSGYGAFTISGRSNVILQNITITNGGAIGQGVLVSNATLNIGSGVVFGACPNRYHVEAIDGASVNGIGAYSITGAAQRHISIGNQSRLTMSSQTITVTGTPAFSSAFIDASQGGTAVLYSNTWTGAATGKRYNVVSNSVIDTFGAGASHLPGSVAGTTATGGQYV